MKKELYGKRLYFCAASFIMNGYGVIIVVSVMADLLFA